MKNVKGTKDILPDESPLWQRLESTFRTMPALFGYKEIRTPIFESTDLFKRGVGEGTDIVGKEMYSFSKSEDGESLTLRPELTASVARAVMQYNLIRHYPTLRLWYYGPCFRYEQPQQGRQRQFHQIGAECMGTTNPEADAEVIILANSILKNCDIADYKLNINSIGDTETRAVYKKVLVDFLNDNLSKLSEDAQKRLVTNPLRTLDSKDTRDREVVKNAPSILDYLNSESKEKFEQLQSLLTASGVSFEINSRLVRGLDYYSNTVFEFITDKLGSQDALGGGGRYDNLTALLGGNPIPGVGFALGVERLILLAQQNEQPAEAKAQVMIVSEQSFNGIVFRVANMLRAQGISVVTDLQQRSFKSQFKDADKSGVKSVVVIGENEAAQQEVTIKNMVTGAQHENVAYANIVTVLQEIPNG